MKKLVVLAMVLGVCSIASASITQNIHIDSTDPGASIELAAGSYDVSINGTVEYTTPSMIWFVASGGVSMSNGAVSTLGTCSISTIDPDADLDPENPGYTWGDFIAEYLAYDPAETITTIFDIFVGDSTDPFANVVGDMVTADMSFTGPQGHLAVIEYGGETLATTDQVLLTPEPITLALLGLGGLFIRRK